MYGFLGPFRKLIRVFQDIGGHLIVCLEGHFGIWPKRLHAHLYVFGTGCLICFEVKPALIKDREEYLAIVKPISSEHGPVAHPAEITQLI